MAADQLREQDELEWSEALIADFTLPEPHASRGGLVGRFRNRR
jgi:hypothetical protein